MGEPGRAKSFFDFGLKRPRLSTRGGASDEDEIGCANPEFLLNWAMIQAQDELPDGLYAVG